LSQDIKDIFENACAAQAIADAATNALGARMLSAMKAVLSSGTVINLRQRPIPEYLLCVRTLKGNDRGTRTFRILEVTQVQVNASNPELSRWEATAIPISEKTGKDMSGTTASSNVGSSVTIYGDMGYMFESDADGRASFERLVNFLAEHTTSRPAPGWPAAREYPALTVKDLHEATGRLMKQGSGDWKLAVPYHAGRETAGSRTSTPITGLNSGFDWNRGTVFAETTAQLGPGGAVLLEQAKAFSRIGGKIFMANRLIKGLKTLDEKQVAELRGYLGGKP
jgi:hypothetical protein